ncbi:hypothetical protein PG988_010532 [Apiospora saccharicola]
MAEETTNEGGLVPPTPLSEGALATLQQTLVAKEQAGGPSAHTASERYLKLQEAHNKLHEAHNGTEERLNQFERRLKKVVSSVSSNSERFDLEDDYQLGYEERTIPETRDMNFEQFKNRYGDQDGKDCIEVLIAGSDFGEQVRQELRRRGELDENDRKRRVDYDDTEEVIIQRVRIQSPALLFLLCKVLDHPDLEWKGQNRTTFYRPFAWFVYAHDKMKEELRKLEVYWSSESTSLTEEIQKETVEGTIARLKRSFPDEITSVKATFAAGTKHVPNTTNEAQPPRLKSLSQRIDEHLLQKALLENYHTFLELKCYIEFVESRIIPDTRRYENPESSEARMVRYQDLWFLFPPGELIVRTRDSMHIPAGNEYRSTIRIGRCYKKEKPDATSTHDWSQPEYLACQTRKPSTLFKEFVLTYYTIGYNGEEFGATTCYASFPFFEGFQEVSSLPAYPLRFHKDSEDIRKTFKEQGMQFKEAVDSRHMAYCGWSRPWFDTQYTRQLRAPDAEGGQTKQQDRSARPIIQNSTYIESDVIVDVKEAIRISVDTYVATGPLASMIPQMRTCQDRIEIIRWRDQKRTEKLSLVQDCTQSIDGVSFLEAIDMRKTDPYAKPHKDPTFTPDDFLLLPNRVYAYALRERKFFNADVRYLRRLQSEGDAFESLKINPKHILIVQAVVASHFQRKEMEERPEFINMMDQDLIRGKGRGLVILLHGAPGVGKTATAEAVALNFNRPLFVITCGDLGFTPQGVESSLSEIFRHAHLWNCILLLDEADVFLSQREGNDLQRNALVSVFLRVLEYYNGILFLTTNRVGTLDEAFKSRVHLSLYYPALGREQTQQIIRMNLDRLRAIEKQRAKITGQKPLFIEETDICNFSTKHYDKHHANEGAGRWNGRQIRNAVQIAASLAWYDRKTSKEPGAEDLPPILDARHFETVEATMTLFEGYMAKAKGGDDASIAEMRGDRPPGTRPDVFRPDDSHGHSGYHPYPSRHRTPQQSSRPQQRASDASGTSDFCATGSPYTRPSARSHQQNPPPQQYQGHAQSGFGAQTQQRTPLTPSPSFSSTTPDQRPRMASGGAGMQGYPEAHMPYQTGPRESYGSSEAVYDVEQQQTGCYERDGSAPRQAHPASSHAFSYPGADMSYMSQGGMNPAQGQSNQWPGTQSAHG